MTVVAILDLSHRARVEQIKHAAFVLHRTALERLRR
jgi:hypothetical protein